MKHLFIALLFSLVILWGCGESVQPTPTFQLIAESSRDSVVITGSGTASKTQSVTSSFLDFTDADSMRVAITYWGTTNNDTSQAIVIGYLQNIIPTATLIIPNTSITANENTLDTTFVSPRVNASFFYQLNIQTTDPNGGNVHFKDLKIYKKSNN